MASILDKYGIKEVADVTLYKIDENGDPAEPVLYLDTLKVSTIEQTAESVDARGGKGNPALISWDFGKEITVTLEDALFSAKSMAVMFGNGTVATDMTQLKKTISWRYSADQTVPPTSFEGPQGKKYTVPSEAVTYNAAGSSVTEYSTGNVYYTTFMMPLKANTVGTIEISANTFPGTYYVTGDTYARSEINGNDEFYQFIIPKAKMQAENTITLEAEGDPSTFNMSLKVLRPAGGKPMMKLVKYDMSEIEA